MSETLDQIHDRLEIERPGFKAEVDRIMAENARNKTEAEQKQAAATQMHRARPRPKFTDLSFVGKKYRSRNRRSANKVTAWAVNPNYKDASTGVDYAWQFMHYLNQLNGTGKNIAGYGGSLAAVIEDMADTLAACKGQQQRDAHLRVIRGFCAPLECSALVYFDSGRGASDDSKALTYAQRKEETIHHKAGILDAETRAFAHKWMMFEGQL